MFLRKISNDRHDIAGTEADFIATKKTNFWLKRAASASAMAKTLRQRPCVLLTDLPIYQTYEYPT